MRELVFGNVILFLSVMMSITVVLISWRFYGFERMANIYVSNYVLCDSSYLKYVSD